MCDDKDGFSVNIPPFARPDYAITTVQTPVEINVAVNDYRTGSEDYVIEVMENETEFGFIEPVNNKGLLKYSPKERFTGFDRFVYSVTDQKTGLRDKGSVTVLVKDANDNLQPGGCYPAEVLECWANGDRQKILGVYLRRHPNNPIDGDISAIASALHDSLQSSNGFNEEELDSLLPLEDPDQRRLLLKCIDPTTQVDDLKWEELGILIRRYQKKNCSGNTEKPLNECYSLSILNCWNRGNLQLLIEFYNSRNATNPIAGGSQEEVYQAVLQSLRETNGFDEKDIISGILKDDNQKRELLKCLEIQFNENMSSNQLGNLILEYQRKNCGGGQIDPGGDNRIELSENELSKRELVAVLNVRGQDVTDDLSESDMITMLKRTSEGMRFSKKEVMSFTKERISKMLKVRGLNASASATKGRLTETLFGD
jgi:hypothetical protein